MIATNDRAAQRKIIKYNHLVATCTIFYNVVVLSKVLQQLHAEEYTIDPEAVAALSPYITEHIDRFGRYSLDMEEPAPLDESLYSAVWLPSKAAPNATTPPQPRPHPTAMESRQLSLDGFE